MKVILQSSQVIVSNLRIGGVQVHDLNGAALQSDIGQLVFQSADVFLRKPVGLAQAGPAILAIHEFVGEPKFQLRVSLQIRNRGNTESFSRVLLHPEGIGVVETERSAHEDIETGDRPPDLFLASKALAGQYFPDDRSGVLGIDVNVSFSQGVPKDPGAPQLRVVDHRDTPALGQEGHHLAQDHALRKIFRSHLKRDPGIGGRPEIDKAKCHENEYGQAPF